MEPDPFKRLIGLLYTGSAVLGIVLSITGVFFLWVTRASVIEQVTQTTELVGRTLDATGETISIADSTLAKASGDLDTVHAMLLDMAASLDSSSGLLLSTADLLGGSMTDFVTNTQTSLTSVQSSAKVVDNMLRAITGIPLIGPFLGGQQYNPDLPLDESVLRVKKGLEPMPAALEKMRRDLDVSAVNVATTRTEIQALATQIDEIQKSLKEARQVVSRYHDIWQELQTKFEQFPTRLLNSLSVAYVLVTIVLLWVILMQIAMLLNGVSMLDNR